MAYIKNPTWEPSGAPGISAVALNNLETQYDDAIADAATDATTKVGTHAALTATHGVSGTIADKADIAVDGNLSANAQNAVTNRHSRSHSMDGASDHAAGTAGDILYAGAAGAWTRLGKGAANQRLVMDSSGNYPSWQDDIVALEAQIGDGTNVITTGIKARIKVPYSGTITAWEIGAAQSGAIQFDLWKDTYANYPPTIAKTIVASDKPKITASAIKATGSALTGWTTAVTAGDWIFVNVDSCTTITQCTLCLTIKKGN